MTTFKNHFCYIDLRNLRVSETYNGIYVHIINIKEFEKKTQQSRNDILEEK